MTFNAIGVDAAVAFRLAFRLTRHRLIKEFATLPDLQVRPARQSLGVTWVLSLRLIQKKSPGSPKW
jgi:hypothetical protein